MKPSAVVPRNGSCAIPGRIPTSFRGAICFTPWPLVPAQKTVFCFGSRQRFICPCFSAFQRRYPSKNDFSSQTMSPSDKPKNKRQRRKGGKASPAFLFEILFPGNRVELFCASALPTLGYRVWFPTPKRGKMKKEKEGTPKRKGMENGSFRYTLILSYLFVFVSNNFLRRWFIPNMNLSSVIGSSCVLSAFLTAFPTWRNRVFVTASTDAVLLGFHLFFVFPALLWRIFRHLYRPLFLCA